MDVYVVSNIWQREGSAVVGAAVDDPGAKSIADRVGAYRWGPWSQHGDTQERVALLADGSELPKLRQEIVRVPLAGYIGDWPIVGLTTEGLNTAVPALIKPRIGDEVRLDPLGILSAVPGPMPSADPRRLWEDLHHDILSDLRGFPPLKLYRPLIDAMRMVASARADNRASGIPVAQIRIGDGGAAKRYFQDGAEKILQADMPRPVDVAGFPIQGLTIVVDPTMPSNMVRIGDVGWLIDVPEPGQMIRLSESALRYLEKWGMLTNLPGSDQDLSTEGRSTPRTPDLPE